MKKIRLDSRWSRSVVCHRVCLWRECAVQNSWADRRPVLASRLWDRKHIVLDGCPGSPTTRGRGEEEKFSHSMRASSNYFGLLLTSFAPNISTVIRAERWRTAVTYRVRLSGRKAKWWRRSRRSSGTPSHSALPFQSPPSQCSTSS